MDVHEVFRIAGGVGTLAMFIPMAVEIVKRAGAGQSFATWLLWAMLDTILAASTIVRNGNFLLPLGYAVGGWLLTGLLLVKGGFRWGRLDSVILGFVFVCLVSWKLGSAKTAIIFTTLATVLATIPGLVELWRNPQRTIGNIWAGYALTNAFSFFGGTAMTVEERFSPAVFTMLALLMVAVSRREYFFARRDNPAKLDSTEDDC
ncbi:MAG TPA: hypothetical protein VHG89_12560 [Verrucomicrobiae bacterium]|nr:hypothetical protein [Verrucomicrobiae bacterium]